MSRPPVRALCLSLLLIGAMNQAGAAAAPATQIRQPVAVELPSALPDKTILRGAWLAAANTPPGSKSAKPDHKARPAIVLLHGCSGAFDGAGKLFTRTRRYADLLNLQGWHVLVLDSYGPRGERSACKPRAGNHRRIITPMQRRRDALGALAWLAKRKDVDAHRLALLGWSNGGNAVLAATNLLHAEVVAAPRRPKAAVAFYPGCELDLRRGYAADADLLLLLGEEDDWTPAQPCLDLAKTDTARISVKVYPGAHHGFDSKAPLKLKRDVATGVRPAEGVHVGGEPDARRDSVKTVLEFLRKQLAS